MRMGIRCLKNEAALKLMATIRINLLPHCVLFLFVNLVALGSAARAEDPRNSRLEQFVETQPNFTTTDVLGQKFSGFGWGHIIRPQARIRMEPAISFSMVVSNTG